MSIVTLILATLAALEQAYIMYIETFATQSTATQRIFNISKEELENLMLSLNLRVTIV